MPQVWKKIIASMLVSLYKTYFCIIRQPCQILHLNWKWTLRIFQCRCFYYSFTALQLKMVKSWRNNSYQMYHNMQSRHSITCKEMSHKVSSNEHRRKVTDLKNLCDHFSPRELPKLFGSIFSFPSKTYPLYSCSSLGIKRSEGAVGALTPFSTTQWSTCLKDG